MIDSMEKYLRRITKEPGKRSGQACIRGMRITIRDIISYLDTGMTEAEIMDDFPKLSEEDIQVAKWYADTHHINPYK